MNDNYQNSFLEDKPGFASMRIGDVLRGLRQGSDTREYKEAVIGIQRQSAPLTAFLVPVLFFIILIVVTASSGVSKSSPPVIVVAPDDDSVEIEELPTIKEPPPDNLINPDNLMTEMEISAPAAPVTEVATASSEPAPAGAKVVKSPVTYRAVGNIGFAGLGGSGSAFGTRLGKGGTGGASAAGALVGQIIDLKRDAQGRASSSGTGNDYWEKARSIVQHKFSPESFSIGYTLPTRVALTHLYVPKQAADNGPKAFGVDQLMQPRGWVAHYTGILRSGKKMRMRFIGQFDDMIVVAIAGRVVLEATWGSDGTKKGQVTGWVSSNRSVCGKWKGPDPNTPLVVGDWVEFTPKNESRMDLLIGERPGGLISGVLMCEVEGEKYETAKDGRPLFPIFASRPLAIQDSQRLEAAATRKDHPWEFGLNYPTFNFSLEKSLKAATKDDVNVNVEI